MQDHRLQQARIKIDQIDAAMAELFEQRMAAVREVIAYKIDHQLPILDVSREEAVIEKGCDQLMTEDTADNGQKQPEHQSKAGGFPDGLIHAVPLFRAVAVGDDGLHTEGDAHLQHTDDHGGLSCNGKGGDILIPMANQQIVLKDAADAV